MKATATMNDQKIFWKDEKADERDTLHAASSSWSKRFLRKVIASFNVPYQTEWEKKCGLHWREWAKL